MYSTTYPILNNRTLVLKPNTYIYMQMPQHDKTNETGSGKISSRAAARVPHALYARRSKYRRKHGKYLHVRYMRYTRKHTARCALQKIKVFSRISRFFLVFKGFQDLENGFSNSRLFKGFQGLCEPCKSLPRASCVSCFEEGAEPLVVDFQ